MREYQVMGIALTDYSVREAMRKTEALLKDGKLSPICYITSEGLLEAESHPQTRELLAHMDLTVAGDTELLKVAGIQNKSRMREIQGNEYLRQFLHRAAREEGGVCLLSDTKERAEKLEKGIASYKMGLRVKGVFCAADFAGDEDSLINEINSLAPAVLISNLEYPAREAFYSSHHMKLHAEVWLILRYDKVIENRSLSLFERLRAFFAKKALRRSVDQYKKEETLAIEKQQEREQQLLKFDTQEIDTEAIEAELAKGSEQEES